MVKPQKMYLKKKIERKDFPPRVVHKSAVPIKDKVIFHVKTTFCKYEWKPTTVKLHFPRAVVAELSS